MASIKMEQFGGMLPAWDDHLLPNGQAAQAINAYLFSGALTGWRTPKLLHQLLNTSAKFAYRIPVVTKIAAAGSLTVVAVPNVGDTITVGEFTYTFANATGTDDPLLPTPYTILIGGSTIQTALNILNALTLDQGQNTNQGITYGDGTGPNPSLDQFGGCTVSSNVVNVKAADIGIAYNNTRTLESTGGVRLSWGATTLTGGTNASFDPSITGSAIWLEFNDPDTNVMRSPVVNDQFNRYYMASPTLAPKYNTYDRIVAGQPAWMLGLNPPGCAPLVNVVGGSDTDVAGLNTSTSSNKYNPGANTMFVLPFTPNSNLQVADIQIMPASTSATANFLGGLYSDNNGAPGDLIATTGLVVGCTAATPLLLAFTNLPPVVQNTKYWFGVMCNDSSVTFQLADDAASAGGFSMPGSFANGPPTPFNASQSGLAPVKVTAMTRTTVTIDTPVAAIAPVNDAILLGPTVSGVIDNVVILSAQANPGDTVLHIVDTGGFTFPPGTLVSDMTTPAAIVGPLITGTINIPDVQMWVDLSGGIDTVIEARAYLYTWITAYGEESAPSPATVVNGWANGNWDITIWSPPPDDMGVDRNITTVRIYRTVPGTTGQTVYYQVADINLADNTVKNVTTTPGVLSGTVIIIGPGQVKDTLGDDQVALNIQLPSTNWFPPPEGLQGILSMPNGMAVGFKDNELWFCEPYRPHAWPPGYVITTEFPIIGIGVSGMAVVAATSGTPYIAQGTAPANMSLIKLPNEEPCTSRDSVLGTGNGVYYTSQKGLIQVNPSGSAINTTELWITRERWSALTPQKNLRAVLQSSCYFAFGSVVGTDNSVAQQGFTIELNTGDAQSFTIWPQPGGHRVGFGKLVAPNNVDVVNLFNDPWTGITCILQGSAVYYYDFTDTAPAIQSYSWTSKIYQQKAKDDFSAMRVFFTVPPNTPTQNATRNTADTDDPSWNTLQTGQYGIVYVYGDGNLVTTRELRTSGELLRIASGQKYEQWQWKIQARVNISNIQAASTVKELRNV